MGGSGWKSSQHDMQKSLHQI